MLFGSALPPALTGIAKLAASSQVLEQKRVVQYFEMANRGVLNRTKVNSRTTLPFAWSVNPYRGCEFACRYCYARYTHEFMNLPGGGDFENRIYAKRFIAPVLRAELRRLDARGGIAIGTATDPYQPAERRFRRTREALAVFAEQRGLTLSITTKSDLVTRDIDLLQAIAANNFISVNMTVTTLDAQLARHLEPRAPRPELRLKAVRALAAAGIPTGVFPNPIMPLITDQEDRLDAVAAAARAHGASYFGGGVLFLMPAAKNVFFPFVEQHFPPLLRRYRERYENAAYLRGPYRESIAKRIAAIRDRHGLLSSPPGRDIAANYKAPEAQLTMFG